MCWTYSGGHCGRHTSPCSESSQSCEDQLWGTAARDCHHSGLYLLHIHTYTHYSKYNLLAMEQCFCHVANPKCNTFSKFSKRSIFTKQKFEKWHKNMCIWPDFSPQSWKTKDLDRREKSTWKRKQTCSQQTQWQDRRTHGKRTPTQTTYSKRKQDMRHKVVCWKLNTKGL